MGTRSPCADAAWSPPPSLWGHLGGRGPRTPDAASSPPPPSSPPASPTDPAAAGAELVSAAEGRAPRRPGARPPHAPPFPSVPALIRRRHRTCASCSPRERESGSGPAPRAGGALRAGGSDSVIGDVGDPRAGRRPPAFLTRPPHVAEAAAAAPLGRAGGAGRPRAVTARPSPGAAIPRFPRRRLLASGLSRRRPGPKELAGFVFSVRQPGARTRAIK